MCVVTPRALPWQGGVEHAVHSAAKELVALGHQVEVWAPANRLDFPDLADVEERESVTYRYFLQPFPHRWTIPPLSLLQTLRAEAGGFDLVHAHLLHQPLAVLVTVLLGRRIPVVVTGHWHGTGHTLLARLAHPLYRLVARAGLRRAAMVLAVSDPEAALLAEHFPGIKDRIMVIPNGIGPIPVGDPYVKTGAVLLSVGRLERYKGVDLSIQALTLLPDEVTLTVIGEGPDRARLERVVADNLLGDRVRFTGRVTAAELGSWWATADCYLSLSLKEAFGLTFGESLAAGVPCVISEIPAHRFVASLVPSDEQNAPPVRLVPARPPMEVLARAIKEVSGLRTNGYFVTSWAEMAEKTADTYQLLIGARRNRNGGHEGRD